MVSEQLILAVEISTKNRESILLVQKFGLMLMPLFTSMVWMHPSFATRPNILDMEVMRYAESKQLAAAKLFAADTLIKNMNGSANSYTPGHTVEFAGGNINEAGMDMDMVKETIDDRINFVVPNIIFPYKAIPKFIRLCRLKNINAPILLGFNTLADIKIMNYILDTSRSKFTAKQEARYQDFNNISLDDDDYEIIHAIQILRIFLDNNFYVNGIHFFSENRSDSVQIFMQEIVDRVEEGILVEKIAGNETTPLSSNYSPPPNDPQ